MRSFILITYIVINAYVCGYQSLNREIIQDTQSPADVIQFKSSGGGGGRGGGGRSSSGSRSSSSRSYSSSYYSSSYYSHSYSSSRRSSNSSNYPAGYRRRNDAHNYFYLGEGSDCDIIYNNSLYSLAASGNGTSQQFQTQETLLDSPMIAFSFCQKLSQKLIPTSCNSNDSNPLPAEIYGFATHNMGITCKKTYAEAWQSTYTYNDSTGNHTVISLEIGNPKDFCTIVVGLICNASVDPKDAFLSPVKFDGGCNYTTTISSSQFCPKYTVLASTAHFRYYSAEYCAISSFFGALLLLWGRKGLKFTIAFISGVIFMFTVSLVFSATFMDGSKAWVSCLAEVCAALVAIPACFACVYFLRFGCAVVCAGAGFLFGVLLNVAWLYLYSNVIVSYCVMGVLGALVAGLMFIKFNETLIPSISFIGSYMFIRPWGAMSTDFPNEIILLGKMRHHYQVTISSTIYIYISLIIAFAILVTYLTVKYHFWDPIPSPDQGTISYWINFRIFPRMTEEEKYPFGDRMSNQVKDEEENLYRKDTNSDESQTNIQESHHYENHNYENKYDEQYDDEPMEHQNAKYNAF